MKDTTIFDDKDLSSLLREIYGRSNSRREVLIDVIKQLREMILDLDTAVMLAPVLKEYIDVLGRSDEHLLKIATVVQRVISAESYQSGGGDPSEILSASEREALLKAAKTEIDRSLTKLEAQIKLPAVVEIAPHE